MRYQVTCEKCPTTIWVHGVYEPDTNATVLDDNCPEWDNGCDHIKQGDYRIDDEEQDDDMGFNFPLNRMDDDGPSEDYTRDHGDSVWPK